MESQLNIRVLKAVVIVLGLLIVLSIGVIGWGVWRKLDGSGNQATAPASAPSAPASPAAMPEAAPAMAPPPGPTASVPAPALRRSPPAAALNGTELRADGSEAPSDPDPAGEGRVFGDHKVELPAGARLVETRIAGERLFLRARLLGGNDIWVVHSLTTGKRLGSFEVVSE